jgi:hypothetical protein
MSAVILTARRSAQNASRCAGALSDTLQVGMQTPSLCEIEDEARAAALALSLAALSVPTWAGAPTVTKHGEWIAHDFKFHGGEVLSELHIRYTTIGELSGEPVLILHGTGGTGDGLLTQEFAGRLFGPGQPLERLLIAGSRPARQLLKWLTQTLEPHPSASPASEVSK